LVFVYEYPWRRGRKRVFGVGANSPPLYTAEQFTDGLVIVDYGGDGGIILILSQLKYTWVRWETKE